MMDRNGTYAATETIHVVKNFNIRNLARTVGMLTTLPLHSAINTFEKEMVNDVTRRFTGNQVVQMIESRNLLLFEGNAASPFLSSHGARLCRSWRKHDKCVKMHYNIDKLFDCEYKKVTQLDILTVINKAHKIIQYAKL